MRKHRLICLPYFSCWNMIGEPWTIKHHYTSTQGTQADGRRPKATQCKREGPRGNPRDPEQTNGGQIIGKSWERIWENCRPCLSRFHGKCMEMICLKAPGNYSASVWTYNFSICLCERSKPNISMISGFLRPVGTLIYGFEYAKSLWTI